MEVTLLTADGGFVTKLQVLPFAVLPQVIQWGDRMFMHGHFTNPVTDGPHSSNFYEVFCYCAPVS